MEARKATGEETQEEVQEGDFKEEVGEADFNKEILVLQKKVFKYKKIFDFEEKLSKIFYLLLKR